MIAALEIREAIRCALADLVDSFQSFRLIGWRISFKRFLRRANLVRRFREWRIELWYGHDWQEAEPSRSGKLGWRCAACGHYSNAPVKAVYDRCPHRTR